METTRYMLQDLYKTYTEVVYTPPTDYFDDIYMSAYVGSVRLNHDTPFYLTDVLTSLYSAEGIATAALSHARLCRFQVDV